MKALKITLMLAVFCLTVSGSSFKNTKEGVNETLKEINGAEMQYAGPVSKDKNKLPGQV
jgi:hypothetical protein